MDTIYYCPECYHKVGKYGFVKSGRKRVQRYSCFKCLRTTMTPLTAEQVADEVIAHKFAQAVQNKQERDS